MYRSSDTGEVRQIDASPDIRAHSTLERVDYADAFVLALAPADDRTAEQWARTMLEGAPLTRRTALLTGWTALGLELRLGQGDTGAVLGWPIARNTAGGLLLSAGSRLGMPAQLCFRVEGAELHFSTFVQLNNAVTRKAWAAVEPRHVPIVRELMEGAGRRQM